MAVYAYKAKNGTATVTGEIEAETESAAIQSIERMGYIPIRVDTKRGGASTPAAAPGRAAASAPRFFAGRISAKEVRTFTKQLSGLVRAKVPLFKALEILHRETPQSAMKQALVAIKEDVRNGKKLSEALAAYPSSFSRVYVSLIAAGEKGAILSETLDSLAEFDAKEEENRSKLRSAFAYPIFMLVVGMATVMAMILFVVPRLTGLYSQMSQQLPFMTRVMIRLSRLASGWGLVLAGAAGVAVFAAVRSGRLRRFRPNWDAASLTLPLFGPIVLRRSIARFSRTLALLLSRGIPIQEAIQASVLTLGNLALEAELAPVAADVASGNPLSKSLAKAGRFPGLAVSLIGVGEESGSLHQTLFEIAAGYDKEIDERIRIMSSLLEPALILAIGSIVGLIVASMLLPIFEINFA